MRIEIYGEGGYDPTKPNNNVVNVTEVPDPDAPTDDRLATLERRQNALMAKLAAATTVAQIRKAAADTAGT